MKPPIDNPPDILVVDDEKRIADTLALILRSNDYIVTTAYDGLQAYKSCRTLAPRLIITDVVMPQMNGVELAMKVRSEFPACLILLFSGQAATADMLREANDRGFQFELLAKPVHPEQLLARVRDLIGAAPVQSPWGT
ncbi:MAG TPA: response regulator [Terriglobales bacterium]|nr:response regulator [Terriglobales bacterium]